MHRRRLLVVSHDAFFGAPRIAADACKGFASRGWDVKCLLLNGGPLLDEFRQSGETLVFPHNPLRALSVRKRAAIEQTVCAWRPDVAYVSTIGCCSVLEVLEACRVPVVLHVHELHSVLKKYCRPFLHGFLTTPALYVAASQSVRAALRDLFDISDGKIEVIYEALDTASVDRLVKSPNGLLARQGFDYVIAGAGRCSHRKGTDLWLRAATELRRRCPDWRLKWVWFGSSPQAVPQDGFSRKLEALQAASRFDGDVEFIDYPANYYSLLSQIDIFALPSREDACPLVVLDSLYLGKPVVCFSEAGGAPEVVGGDCGICVRPASASALAIGIAELLRDDGRRHKMGANGRAKISRLFSTPTLQAGLERAVGRCASAESGAVPVTQATSGFSELVRSPH